MLNADVSIQMMIVKNKKRNDEMIALKNEWMIGRHFSVSTSVYSAADAKKRKIFIFIIKKEREGEEIWD